MPHSAAGSGPVPGTDPDAWEEIELLTDVMALAAVDHALAATEIDRALGLHQPDRQPWVATSAFG